MSIPPIEEDQNQLMNPPPPPVAATEEVELLNGDTRGVIDIDDDDEDDSIFVDVDDVDDKDTVINIDDEDDEEDVINIDDDDDDAAVSTKTSLEISKMEDLSDDDDQEGLRSVLSMFPDVDPTVLLLIVEKGKTVEEVADQLARDSNYPKLKKRVEKERRERRRQEFLDPHSFHAAVYLRNFEEDPERRFLNEERTVSTLYVEHARVGLMNEFPSLREDFISKTMREHGNLYFPTLRALQNRLTETESNNNTPGPSTRGGKGKGCRGRGKQRKRGIGPLYLAEDRIMEDWPEMIDETFFRELQYATFQWEIKDFQSAQKAERQGILVEARETGTLQDCPICADDEILPGDMISCRLERHSFCRTCVRGYAEAQIGEGFHRVRCLAADCDDTEENGEIPLKALRDVLPARLIDLILTRTMGEEVRRAGFENIEQCPFCEFALIMEDENDRVFRCLNQDCLKESCRECKEENHIPMRCDEVMKADEAQMRNYIANKMSEAMVRVCPRCKKRRRGPGEERKCPMVTKISTVHANVAEKAGEEAREKYLMDHPEMRDKEMIPLVHLTDKRPRTEPSGRRGRGRRRKRGWGRRKVTR